MFLFPEDNFGIRVDEIIGVFDLDKTTVSKRAREYLKEAQDNGRLVSLNEELPKSFIVKVDNKVIISKLMTKTIENRVIRYEKK